MGLGGRYWVIDSIKKKMSSMGIQLGEREKLKPFYFYF